MADKTVIPGTTIQFKDASNETGATYIWNFGIGEGTSNLQNPTHRYDNLGLYTITHSVTNNCGNTDSCASKTVEVLAELPPSGGGSSVVLMLAAAAIGLMMMAKK